MRCFLLSLLALTGAISVPSLTFGQEEIFIEESSRGIPVQTAILRRRYGAVITEDEVAGAEFEAGLGATNTFQSVHWRRWNRPVGWWGWNGFYGPGFGVGFRPRFAGYYPWVGPGFGWGGPGWVNTGWRGPVWGGGWGAPVWGSPVWGGGWGGTWGPAPVTVMFAPQSTCCSGFGGCYYW